MKLREALARLLGATMIGDRQAEPRAPILDQYVAGPPSAQNAVDLIPGWNHAFPPQAGVVAGDVHLYHDPRILWCLEQVGSVEGRTVLELGPLEAMHTYMLSQAGAARIDAIEANSLAYLKCLIAKEILDIRNARFLLGDYHAWLAETDARYDLIVASGVLYHSAEPVELIRLMSRRTNAFFLWTHYFDEVLSSGSDPRGQAFSGRTSSREISGVTVTLHERSYHSAWNDPKFCGGLQDTHFWLDKRDILRIIDVLGFDAVLAHDDPDHPGGPAVSILAKHRPSAEGEVGQAA